MNSRHQFQCASRWLSVSIVRHRTSGSPTLFAETQPTLGDVRQLQADWHLPRTSTSVPRAAALRQCSLYLLM